jgi:uncharacterized membrane protein YfhO
LRLHVSDVPGWHATLDGHPLALEPVAGFMFQARIPPGRHVIELWYWPPAFTLGLVIAGITVAVLASALVLEARAARRKRDDQAAPGRARPKGFEPSHNV